MMSGGGIASLLSIHTTSNDCILKVIELLNTILAGNGCRLEVRNLA